MKRLQDPKSLPQNSGYRYVLMVAIFIHILLLWLLQSISADSDILKARKVQKKTTSIPIRLVEEPNLRRQIIEAPMLPTEPPDPEQDAFLGRQNRRAEKEQRLPPSSNRKGAEATRYSSRSPKSQAATEAAKQEGEKPGKSEQKSGQGQLAYNELLPQTNDFEGYFNDFIPDENIPVGDVMDVNTTEYRFIGYFSMIRKQVEHAYYSPLSSLRHEPRIKERLDKYGRIEIKGISVAQLTVIRNGMVIDTRIVKSSGDPAVDEAWLRILNLAAPFPPLPKHFPEEQLTFTYSLYYGYVLEQSQPVRQFHF